MDTWRVYFWIGNGLLIALYVGYKFLLRPKFYWSALFISLVIAAFGLSKISDPELIGKNSGASIWLLSPFLFIVSFGIYRQIFLRIFKNEPLMTRAYMMSWDDGEYRRLHFGDAIFTVMCLMTPLLSLLFYSIS